MDHMFTEKILRMSRTWLALQPQVSIPKAKAIATVDKPIFGFCGQLGKISNKCLEFWSAACKAVPEALVVIKDRQLGDKVAEKKLTSRLESYGITSERIYILTYSQNWVEHMKHYNAIDIALDSTPWSSATTAFDVLAMGVPLMAIQGKTASARMSSSVVHGAGKPEWICRTPDDYANLAQSLCKDFRQIRNNKANLQEMVLSGPLYDTQSVTREFERLIRSVVKRTP
jgi:predicted O-linked N-acetylglucosamine transferase (SPINDLY family)